jgi:hypothetical protein
MSKNPYTIGVVTYHARFESYFKPLIKKLRSVFPDKEILVIVNGHPDKTLQISYLSQVTEFLIEFRNVRYLTYDEHQSLSKCWNQLVILTRTEKILIMNDDTQVAELFREELEKKLSDKDFSTINSSWSHFLISKGIIRKVGWFDERLLGIGHEDIDYGLRMSMANIEATNTECFGLKNYVASQDNPGWKNISPNGQAKRYSHFNFEFFNEKWDTMGEDSSKKPEDYERETIWNGSRFFFSPKIKGPTPVFYDFKCLDNTEQILIEARYMKNRVRTSIQKLFYFFRSILKKIYRSAVR